MWPHNQLQGLAHACHFQWDLLDGCTWPRWYIEHWLVVCSCSHTLILPIASSTTSSHPTPHDTRTHIYTHTTRNWAIISNSLLSSSYAQQLLNFGGNFQKILSVSLSEIACPDAPLKKKKILNLEKTQNISKGKYWKIGLSVSFNCQFSKDFRA